MQYIFFLIYKNKCTNVFLNIRFSNNRFFKDVKLYIPSKKSCLILRRVKYEPKNNSKCIKLFFWLKRKNNFYINFFVIN